MPIETLPNLPILLDAIASDELVPLQLYAQAVNTGAQAGLVRQRASNLNRSYVITDPGLVAYIDLLLRPSMALLARHLARSSDLVLSSAWINFQRAGEYQALHRHQGEISWVIWLDTPYRDSEQRAGAEFMASNLNRNGVFSFTYTNVLGQIVDHVLAVDREWNGRFALFPSELMHSVAPFYSRDPASVRTSLSGNYTVREG
jgi:hypothetical protein